MPIYEYSCFRCGKRSSFLILAERDLEGLACRFCGSKRLERLISRVALVRSEEARLESLADPTRWGDLDEQNPASIARWVKQMGRELGEDMGEDIDAALEAELHEQSQEQGEASEG